MRALKIGCGSVVGILVLVVLFIVVAAATHLGAPKQTATTTTQTTTTRSAGPCNLHVSRATVRAIANGLDNRRIALRYDAVATKLKRDLYAVTGRIVGPGMSVYEPTIATWITNSITSSPTIVWSGERLAAMYSQWGKAPYIFDEGDVLQDNVCFPSGG